MTHRLIFPVKEADVLVQLIIGTVVVITKIFQMILS